MVYIKAETWKFFPYSKKIVGVLPNLFTFLKGKFSNGFFFEKGQKMNPLYRFITGPRQNSTTSDRFKGNRLLFFFEVHRIFF